MKNRFKVALGITALMSSLAASGLASADSSRIGIRSYTPGSVSVLSDGNGYTKLSHLQNMNVKLNLYLSADTLGRVKDWSAWFNMRQEGGPRIHFNQYKDSASYSRPRPKTVTTVASVLIPALKIQSVAVADCQAHANKLRLQGLSAAAIYSKDWTLTYALEGSVTYEMTGAGGNRSDAEVEDFAANKKFRVICKASPGPTRNPADSNPSRTKHEVKSASLSVQGVSTLNGACMLKLKGKIKGEKTRQKVRFRYKDGQGHQSEIKTVETKTLKTARFSHQYALSGGGLKTGKIRIDVEGSNVNSPWVNYSVNCSRGTAPGGFNTPTTPRPVPGEAAPTN
ncbi:MAG: hypothetical protein ABJN40_11175 [Sneathiella sp.]